MGRWGALIFIVASTGCMQAIDVNKREADLQQIAVEAWNARADLPRCGWRCQQDIWGLEIVHTDTVGMFFACGAGRNGCYNSRQYFAFNTDYFESQGEFQADKDWVVLHETVHALGDYSGLGDSDGNHSDMGRRWGMWRGSVLYEAYGLALATLPRGQ